MIHNKNKYYVIISTISHILIWISDTNRKSSEYSIEKMYKNYNYK